MSKHHCPLLVASHHHGASSSLLTYWVSWKLVLASAHSHLSYSGLGSPGSSELFVLLKVSNFPHILLKVCLLKLCDWPAGNSSCCLRMFYICSLDVYIGLPAWSSLFSVKFLQLAGIKCGSGFWHPHPDSLPHRQFYTHYLFNLCGILYNQYNKQHPSALALTRNRQQQHVNYGDGSFCD
jgi:hypothetical protein